jgi:hypothetical protein
MRRALVCIILLVTCGVLLAQAEDPKQVVAEFFAAIHDFNGEKVWNMLCHENQQKLDDEFEELVKSEELSDFAEEFNSKELLYCRNGHELMVCLFRVAPTAVPDEAEEMRHRFDSKRIKQLLSSARVSRNGKNVVIALQDGYGDVELILEEGKWKIKDPEKIKIF